MKKITLVLLLGSLTLCLNAQDLELYYGDVLLSNSSVINLSAHADSGLIVLDDIGVKNVSSNPFLVICSREILDLVPGSLNSFCWGLCYPPAIDTASVNIKIESGEISMEFQGDHDPMGYEGVSTVKYTFYELDNPDNQSSFTVNYNAEDELSVYDPTTSEISGAYPNPANREVNIDFVLNNTGKYRLVIYDLLGNIVKDIAISENEGSLKLNTSTFNEGIYFYSLLVNNESITTHKLIIKH